MSTTEIDKLREKVALAERTVDRFRTETQIVHETNIRLATEREAALAQLEELRAAGARSYDVGKLCAVCTPERDHNGVLCREHAMLKVLQDNGWSGSIPADQAIQHLANLQDELDIARRQADCDCVPAIITSKACRKCGRKSTIPQEQLLRTIGRGVNAMAALTALWEHLHPEPRMDGSSRVTRTHIPVELVAQVQQALER